MSLYVYVVKYSLNTVPGFDYILSTPLTQENAIKFKKTQEEKGLSKGNYQNKIVELHMTESDYQKFRDKQGIMSFCRQEDIDAFYQLNNKYQTDKLKFMAPAASSEPQQGNQKEDYKSNSPATS